MAPTSLLLGSDIDEVTRLAGLLGADEVQQRSHTSSSSTDGRTGAIEAWRERCAEGPQVDRVAVAMWSALVPSPAPLLDVGDDDWTMMVDDQIAAWVAGLGAGARRCADGGTLVAVLERPAPLDGSGWASQAGVADAVEALVRSLARSEGARGVRVNAVTTPLRLAPDRVIAPVPPLASYPGTVAAEVGAAAAMMLGEGVAGVTGAVLHADCGRSWR